MSFPTADRHRPRYHFSPDNWMNDPKPFFHNGAYHVFFQHNPLAADWGDMCWGHAVSRDLCGWEKLPIALAPTPDGSDAHGCWTGCVVAGEEAGAPPRILYTGIPTRTPFTQVQCLATALDDDLVRWEKWSGNPIIAPKPDGYGECFRDPQVFLRGGKRYMVIGGEQLEKRGGAAFLYEPTDDSGDLTRWSSRATLFEADDQTGYDFECPDFFAVDADEEHWLLVTSREKVWWHVGALDDDLQFVRRAWGACDEGGLFYAAKTMLDGLGRRLMFGWILEGRGKEERIAAGWSGVLSLPRVVTLGDDDLPRFVFAPELENLRVGDKPMVFQNVRVGAKQTVSLPRVNGTALEIEVRFADWDAEQASSCGLSVLRAPDGNEELRVAPMPTSATLRVFVDGSIVESFGGDGRACRTQRFYTTRDDSDGVAIWNDGDVEIIVPHVTIWQLSATADWSTKSA